MSPARRRRALTHLQRVLGVSERWACQLVGQYRPTQRRPRPTASGSCASSSAHSAGPTLDGAPPGHAELREAGWTVNRKTVQQWWRDEGLRVSSRRRKRQRLGTSSTPADRLAAEHPDHVWALDYQFDQTTDGRRLKPLNVAIL